MFRYIFLSRVLILISASTAGIADEPRPDRIVEDYKVSLPWELLKIPDGQQRVGWTLKVLKNLETNDLLTIACLDSPGRKSIDDAVEFAPSGYPWWFPNSRIFTINVITAELVKYPSAVPDALSTVAYTVVNDHESDDPDQRLMASGFVLPIDNRTYYIQHTSHNPISDSEARIAANCIIKSCLLNSAN